MHEYYPTIKIAWRGQEVMAAVSTFARVLACVWVLVAALGLAPAAGSAERVALVVGVSQYRSLATLANAARDASAIAAALNDHGFVTTMLLEPDASTLVRRLDEFKASTTNAREVILFYSGHGMTTVESNAFVNTLAPIDASISCENLSSENTVSMDRFLSAIDHIEKQVGIFDSCRDNPFPFCASSSSMGASRPNGFAEIRLDRSSRANNTGPDRNVQSSGERGLVPQPASEARMATLVAYSTAANRTASDGPPGQSSPFAKVFLDEMKGDPTRPFAELMDRVSRRVIDETGQRPFVALEGGAPFLCLAGKGCRGIPQLEIETQISKAGRATEEAASLMGRRAVHQALASSSDAARTLRAAGLQVPDALQRQLRELARATPYLRRQPLNSLAKLKGTSNAHLRLVRASEDGNLLVVRRSEPRPQNPPPWWVPSSGALAVIDRRNDRIVFDSSEGSHEFEDFQIASRGTSLVNCITAFNPTTNGARSQCTAFGGQSWTTRGVVSAPPTSGNAALRASAYAGEPAVSADGTRFALAEQSGRRPRIRVLAVPPMTEGAFELELLPDENRQGTRDHMHIPLVKFSPSGDSIAVLGTKRFYLFQKRNQKWQRFILNGVFDEAGRPEFSNFATTFDVDFELGRLVYSSIAYRPVAIYFKVDGDKIFAESTMVFDECVFCASPRLGDGGRIVTFFRPFQIADRAGAQPSGNEGRLVTYALPDRPAGFNLFLFGDFSMPEPLLVNNGQHALAIEGTTLIVADILRRYGSHTFTIPNFTPYANRQHCIEPPFMAIYGEIRGAELDSAYVIFDLDRGVVTDRRQVTSETPMAVGPAHDGGRLLALGSRRDESPLQKLDPGGKLAGMRFERPRPSAKAGVVSFLADHRFVRIDWEIEGRTVSNGGEFATVHDTASGNILLDSRTNSKVLTDPQWAIAPLDLAALEAPCGGRIVNLDRNRINVQTMPDGDITADLSWVNKVLGR